MQERLALEARHFRSGFHTEDPGTAGAQYTSADALDEGLALLGPR